MNVKEYTTEISARLALRSFFIYAFAASLIVNVILAIGLIVLDKKDRVVVLPAEITKSFWLDADGVSPEYLEQIGLFALQLALNNSPETFEHNQRKLLQYVSPEQRGATEVFLTAQGRRMKSANASVHMLPEAVETRASTMQVSVLRQRSPVHRRQTHFHAEEVLDREVHLQKLSSLVRNHAGSRLQTTV